MCRWWLPIVYVVCTTVHVAMDLQVVDTDGSLGLVGMDGVIDTLLQINMEAQRGPCVEDSSFERGSFPLPC